MPSVPARRRLRMALIVLALLVLLPLAALGVALATVDPDAWRPQIVAAVSRATGRTLAIARPIALKPSLWPTVTVQGVTLTGQGQTITVARVEARLALLPLLSRRVEIDRLLLTEPRVTLGGPQTAAPAPAPPPAAQPVGEPAKPLALFMRMVRIEGGRIAGMGQVLDLRRVDLTAANPAAPIELAIDAALNGVPVHVTGTTGPLAALRGAGGAFPVRLDLSGPAGHIAVDATLADPAHLARYDLKLDGRIAETNELARMLPGVVLPLLHDVAIAGTLDGSDDRTQLDLTATVAGARLTAKGSAGHAPAAVDVALAARVPDLAALAPPGQAWPSVRDIRFAGRLVTQSGGGELRDVSVQSSAGDAAGMLKFTPGARPRIEARLTSRRIDLDALRSTSHAPPGAPGAIPATPQPEAASPQAARQGRLIPDTPLPLAALRAVDADLSVQIAELVSDGATSRNLTGTLKLTDGRLVLDPFGAALPSGRLDGALLVDASQPAPPVALKLRAPGLAIQPLMVAIGLPPDDAGALEVDADLHGAGANPRAIAASLGGHLGLAMVDGAIDNRLLTDLAAPLLRSAKLPPDLAFGKPGRSAVRCLALRLDADGGVATLRSALLDMTLLRLEGSGRIDLRDEALDLHLKPLLRLSGSGIALPVHVGGTLAAPHGQVDAGEAAKDAAGAIAPGLAAGGKEAAFRAILGALTAPPPGAQACGEQLAAARGGVAGPMPAGPAPGPAPGGAPAKPPKPIDLLRQLFR